MISLLIGQTKIYKSGKQNNLLKIYINKKMTFYHNYHTLICKALFLL
ncbi:MAG: hypothetical protein K0S41_2895 [Anaerocolumna sp.]|jgi:hypothetical protein|nr:hypothetical protein [Anaerocolumna sp.]